MRATVLTLLVLLLMPGILSAQENEQRETPEERAERQGERPRLGLFGGAGLNFHAGAFQGIPEAPTCMPLDEASFDGTTAFGYDIGLLFEYPIAKDFAVELRGGYYDLGGTLRTDAYLAPTFVADISDTASVVSQYELEALLGLAGLELTLGWSPLDIPLTFRLGPSFGTLFRRGYAQREVLQEPSNGVFIAPDGSSTRVRNETADDILSVVSQFGATLGADYELPMNEEGTLLLVPELRFNYAFSNIREGLDWQVHRGRLGLALKYVFPLPVPDPPPAPLAEAPTPPPPPPSRPELVASLDLQGVDRDGNVQEETLKITVEEFINTQTHALLNYIFFDEGSSAIPVRYVQYGGDATGKFDFTMLRDQGTLAVYHQILNIIGSRMAADPGARITLTGTNMNEGVEENNRDLSRSRAESIRSYLTDRWGIAENRIGVEARNLPKLPSNVDSADGDEENRRVEITSNRASLLEPVRTDDTLRTVDPPMLRAVPGADAEAGLAEWSLQIRQGSDLLKEFEGTGDIPASLDWNIEEDPLTIPRRQAPLTAVLSVRDDDGQTGSAAARLPVEQITIRRKREERLGDFVYDRFNLITFEFNSARLSSASRKIASDIREVIQPTSEVTIVGYSDRLGEEEHNQKLSEERASTTARELRVPQSNARGGGENTELYNNDLPEGRFYSRTVSIVVKTPVE